VRYKLRESEKRVITEPEAFFFYLSAFLAAAEALRNLLKPFGFDWDSRPEPERSVLNFMHKKRVSALGGQCIRGAGAGQDISSRSEAP
jgi:hypothetical protein